jgi:hypothetical protein
MGTASNRRGGGPRERRPRHGEQDRLTRAKQDAKNVDPIFSSPYKPAEAQAAPHQAPPQRATRQVAALLGGLLKNK